MVKAKDLVGRRVVALTPNPFDDGRGGVSYDPQIELDNGAILTFTVDETDTGDYGVTPAVVKNAYAIARARERIKANRKRVTQVAIDILRLTIPLEEDVPRVFINCARKLIEAEIRRQNKGDSK